MKIHGMVAIIACSLLYGCATAPRFSEAEFPRNDADLEILATQQEIDSETNVTNPGAAGGGLLGVLIATSIDNTKNDRAEEAVTPIRDYLIDYDMTDQFVERIEASGVAERLVVGAEAVVRQSVRKPEERDIDRPLIMIEPHVQLSNDMRALMVDLNVWEMEPGEGERSAKKGVSQSYRFLWPLEDGDGLDRTEAVAAWVERPRDEMIDLIEMGMDETLNMLDEHLRQQTLVFEDKETRIRIPAAGHYNRWQTRGDFIWVADSSGWGRIYAVPERAIY